MTLDAMAQELSTFPNHVISTWVAVRAAADAIDRAADDRTLDDSHVDTLFDAWRRLLETMGVEPPRRLSMLTELWEARAVDLRLAREPGYGKMR
jgi:hypothetical protein